jgi:predicted ATPase/DNA-binding SARP family transcriptional activator
MTELTIRLLGAPLIELDGRPIAVDTRKAIALLVYLAVTRQTHQRAALAALLWPDSDQARATLRRTLTALTQAIGKEWIAADRETIGLAWQLIDEGALWLDIARFDELIDACRGLDDDADDACQDHTPLLSRAVELYRGEFLAGFTLVDCLEFDDWQVFQAEKYRQTLARALQKLARCHWLQGDSEAAIDTARRWVALDPLHEPAQQALMTLYAQAGQRANALRQYQECVRVLEQDLGVEPQPETTTLYEQIRDPVMANGPERPFPPLTPLRPLTPSPRHNLPLRATSLVGREKEQQEIQALLDNPDCRLVTVIGPGGIGKTRLALAVAEAQIGHFAHGVYFVPLGPVSSTDYLVSTMAEALRFTFYNGRQSGQQKGQLLDYLREKEMLLVIDNFEHLLDGAALLSQVLQQAPAIKLLVTSQERLNLQEEWLVEIHGLQCPSGRSLEEALQSGAAQLFTQRARQVQPDFTLTDEDFPALIDICRLVGGMPLGIELASAWVRMLSCQEIAEQIKNSLDFLETSLRNVPERHRSLRAVFERSWQILSDEESRVFQQLSVFRGGFQMAAAMRVADAPLSLLLALTDKSLLRRSSDGRFEIPEALHQYAQEKRRQRPQPEVESRHGAYYLALLAQQETDLKGAAQKTALAEISVEIENIRQAWQWGLANGQTEAIDQALLAFFIVCEMQGWVEEGAQICRQAAAQLPGDEGLAAQLTAVEGAFLARLSQYGPAQEALERALAALRTETAVSAETAVNVEIVAFTLYNLGIVAEAAGERPRARELLAEGLALYREQNDQWGMGNVLNALGNVSVMLREPEAARHYYEESLHIRRQIGDQRGVALCYHNLGNVNQSLAQYDAARELYQQSVSIKRELNDRRGVGYTLNNLGYMTSLLEAYDEALSYLEESLATLRDVGDRRGIGYALMNLGNVAHAQAEHEKAAQLYRESLETLQAIGDQLGIAYAQEHLGNAALARREYLAAADHYQAALTVAQAIQITPLMLDALLGIAGVKKATGEMAEGIELLGLILAHPDSSARTRQRAETMWGEWALSEPEGMTAVAQPVDPEQTLAALAAVYSRAPNDG